MMEAVKKYEDTVKEVVELSKRQLGTYMLNEYMDDDARRLLQATYRLEEVGRELTIKQIKLLVEMNEKLDRLMLK